MARIAPSVRSWTEHERPAALISRPCSWTAESRHSREMLAQRRRILALTGRLFTLFGCLHIYSLLLHFPRAW